VDYHEGHPSAVPPSALQSKGDRYYFQLSWPLDHGQVYVSPFDLNVERGEIEQPWKPVIRLATPIFDSEGVKRGIFVLNYLGQDLLDRLRGAGVGGESWLVNDEGYYLVGPTEEDSWAFMFGKEPTFAVQHPAAWSSIQEQGSGELVNPEGLYEWQSFEPGPLSLPVQSRVQLRLKLVTLVETGALYADSFRSLQLMLVGGSLLGLVLAAAFWRLAYTDAIGAAQQQAIRSSEERLRQLSTGLLEAQERERRSISRDLHDEFGQVATAIIIDLKEALRVEDGEERTSRIQRSIDHVSDLLSNVHSLAERLRTNLLDDLGLEAALRSHCDEFERRSGIQVDLQLDLDGREVPKNVSSHAYRVVQEALQNVLRHSGSREAFVSIRTEPTQVCLEVRDRGSGFNAEEGASRGLGVLGMRERVELLGGSFHLDSSAESGTLVQARIPLVGERGA